ncbi:MAG: tRNA (adenosine(37)-N6)-dimethylallyltransferase MiaA [Alphaproteobacteria bacterium]
MAGSQKTVLVIGGPTASGKSGLALSVAAKHNGVIINADSMQLYDGLPVLTAQPSAADKAAAAHRLYAHFPPDFVCSSAKWRDLALAEIEAALAKDSLPIVVGGTGFYLKTLIQGLSPIPDVPHELRGKIAAQQRELGNPAFHAELAKRDPKMAAKLHPFNTQRLVRAWEVLEATGKSLADWQDLPREAPPAHLKFVTVTLLPPRTQLYTQCDERFGLMIKAGALEEAKEFMPRVQASWPLAKALGYPELASHMSGKLSLTDAITLAQAATRHYAKRQVTWFRHQLKTDLVLTKTDAAAMATLLS